MQLSEESHSPNPCGLEGFAFLEFSGPDPSLFHARFSQLGFKEQATGQKGLRLYQQGNIQFIVNEKKNSQAEAHAKQHGPGVCAMGFKVKSAEKAYQQVLKKGASPLDNPSKSPYDLPAISAIGGSLIYFVDEAIKPFPNLHLAAEKVEAGELLNIDHLTHNVHRGNMDKWAAFYESLFAFKEIRFFDIHGKMTGLISRALASPCGKIKIPLNESTDDKSQIEEFLHEYHGEGIQHVALSTSDIYASVHRIREKGLKFLDVPDTYYEMIDTRIPWHHEPLAKLQAEQILIDGEQEAKKGLLLQIFTENLFGPAFFEIIQREGNEGFGEGNFQALFEAIERDQIRRGTLTAD